jgi:hypothetical protein
MELILPQAPKLSTHDLPTLAFLPGAGNDYPKIIIPESMAASRRMVRDGLGE